MKVPSYAPMRKDSGIDIDPPCYPHNEDLTPFKCCVNQSSLEPIHPESKPLVAVIGVGYVGHHLVQVFSRQYTVVGFDVSENRIRDIVIDFATTSDTVRLTSSPLELAEATHYLISVPTLLLPNKTIDTSYLRNAVSIISPYVRPGSTVVIESSVAVGMTRELIGPLALEKGCFAGMSPERVDPGRVEPAGHVIPKIVSGLDDVVPGSLARITELYQGVFHNIVPVSKPEVAEMTKLYENCQRMMCIAYANEMADACIPFGIDPYEVSKAAATKPFGYMNYVPGIGVGGHCIPINPYYLLANSEFPLLKAATEKMWDRPAELARRASETLAVAYESLHEEGQAEVESSSRDIVSDGDGTFTSSPLLRRSKSDSAAGLPSVLVVGLGFKRGQSTLSNSPGVQLAKSLHLSQKVNVYFADPLVPQSALPHVVRLGEDEWSVERLNTFNSIIIAVPQVGLDFRILNKVGSNVQVAWWCSKESVC